MYQTMESSVEVESRKWKYPNIMQVTQNIIWVNVLSYSIPLDCGEPQLVDQRNDLRNPKVLMNPAQNAISNERNPPLGQNESACSS